MERNIVNKSCSAICVDSETYFHPYPKPKNRPFGQKKNPKNFTQKLGQNQKTESERTWKKKFVQLHKETQHSK